MKSQKVKPLEADKKLQENYNRINNFVESLFPSKKLGNPDVMLSELEDDPYGYEKDQEAQSLNSRGND